MPYIVATFYHFFPFPHFAETRAILLAELKRLDIKGTLLITPEGINSTLSGTREAMDEFLAYLKTEIIHGELEHKESLCDHQPFGRTKVRLKKETISLGEPVGLEHIGTYVDPADWNALIADPDTIVIDTRNDYETHLGSFDGATDPKISNFKALPEYVRSNMADAKKKKIATFCTGGIRCEKFTAWLAQEGFEEVYHLKGGILKYLEVIPESESKWHGECYVFDDRVAVGHGLKPTRTARVCPSCGDTVSIMNRQCANCTD